MKGLGFARSFLLALVVSLVPAASDAMEVGAAPHLDGHIVLARARGFHGGVHRGGVHRHVNRHIHVNRHVTRNVTVNRGIYRGPNVYYRGGAWVRPRSYWWPAGGAIAAGAAIGLLTAAAAASWAGQPPGPNYCWYYTDASKHNGFWDVCR